MLVETMAVVPFLPSTGDELYEAGLTLEAALGDRDIVRRAIVMAKDGEINCADLRCAAAARLAAYISAAAGTLGRFAVRAARAFGKWLNVDIDKAIELARSMGLDADRANNAVGLGPQYAALRWIHFLKYAPRDWAMINYPVIKGWVVLEDWELKRIMEEAYKASIVGLAKRDDMDYIIGLLRMDAEIGRAIEELKRPPRVKATGEFPPCMQGIMDSIRRGDNAPHAARFAVTTYLIKRGWDVERIVDLFRSSPDFNERITRYQVNHIAGKVGGRKEYSVPNCTTMGVWGLCVAKCGVRSPLQYRGRARP